MKAYNIYEAPLSEGAPIELVYPSSRDGEPTPRKGVVERVGRNFVVVAIGESQYRTFRFERIVGGTVKVGGHDTCPKCGRQGGEYSPTMGGCAFC